MSEEHSVFHEIDLLPRPAVVSERMISFCSCSERFFPQINGFQLLFLQRLLIKQYIRTEVGSFSGSPVDL